MFRYFGSKASSASSVADLALNGLRGSKTIADAFGGLGNIGAEFKKRGHDVTTCDLLLFPHIFQHVRIACQRRPTFQKLKAALSLTNDEQLLTVLNTPNSASAWFIDEYSIKRGFFTEDNAKRISSAWSNICSWSAYGFLSENEKKFLLASLLNSADSVANTAGTYYAYLKNWGRKPLKTFEFNWLEITKGSIGGTTLRGDALECLKGKSFDLLYLDPPYNSRDYSRYYHLPETLAGMKEIEIDKSSMAGLPVKRPDGGKLIRSAMKLNYLKELIESVSWKRLIVQYADGAYVPLTEFEKLLRNYGSLKVSEVEVLGYKTKNVSRKQAHHVFIVNA